jgi:glycosyltransferase involved in cell wall biosynthesis
MSKPIKILFEGSPMFRNRSGVGQYTYHLFRHLAAQDKKNRYVVFGFLLVGKKFSPPLKAKNIRYKLIRYFPSKFYSLASRKLIPPPVDVLLAEKFDLAVFTNFVSTPLPLTKRSMSVIYDLSYEYVPQYSVEKNNQLLRRQVPKTIRRSSAIITISENSKKEIIGCYKIAPEKVHIIRPAVDHDSFRPRDASEEKVVADKFGIDGPYILSVCTLEPRKNLIGVLRAFEKLPEDIKSSHTLVLAGGRGWLDGQLQSEFEKLSQKYRLLKTGYVDDADLPALYSGASIFVYPSFYEGFGMPPLEAMACGTPVVASDNSSLPEVIGDAGIMVKANDTTAIAKSIQKVISDPTLSNELRKKGLAQAKKFTWDQSAATLLGLIEDLSV